MDPSYTKLGKFSLENRAFRGAIGAHRVVISEGHTDTHTCIEMLNYGVTAYIYTYIHTYIHRSIHRYINTFRRAFRRGKGGSTPN